MAFTYSQEDVARTAVVKETVTLECLITRYEEKVSKNEKNAGAINHVITMKVDDPSSEYNGLVLTAYFPEAYPGLAFEFLKAMGEEIRKGGGSVHFEEFVNQRVQVIVAPGEYNNKPTNQIQGYRPAGFNPVNE